MLVFDRIMTWPRQVSASRRQRAGDGFRLKAGMTIWVASSYSVPTYEGAVSHLPGSTAAAGDGFRLKAGMTDWGASVYFVPRGMKMSLAVAPSAEWNPRIWDWIPAFTGMTVPGVGRLFLIVMTVWVLPSISYQWLCAGE